MIALRRFCFAAAAVLLAILAGSLFALVITASGTSRLQVLQVLLLMVCCLWLAWGFNTAVAGILSGRRERRSVPVPFLWSASRTAVLVPVYNEDADAVFARVAAMIEGLRSIKRLETFDFHVLSDSTRADCVEAERRAAYLLTAEIEAGGHLYYRNRVKNVGRKAGNIADFVTTSGGAYEYMLVLDADSLMRPQTILEMVTRMDADPELALLQTQPLIIGRRTLFGRGLQFSAALFSPIWLMFLVVSLLDPIIAAEPNYFPADSLFPVFPTPETGKALLLLLGIFLLLLLPKTLIAFSSAFGPRRRMFGGMLQVLMGATAELAMTSVLAPVMMMFQSKAVAEILIGADGGWPSTEREDGRLPVAETFKSSWWMVIAGAALLGVTFFYSPNLFLWVSPIAVPLMLSPLLISWTGDPALGDAARRWGIFATPFELDPEPVIKASAAWRRRLAALNGERAAGMPGRTASLSPETA